MWKDLNYMWHLSVEKLQKMQMHLHFVFATPRNMVTECLWAAAAPPQWSAASVPPKTETKHPLAASLLQKLGIEDITVVFHSWQLWWCGHAQRAMSCIKSVTDLRIPSTGGRGRPRKTWSECVKNVSECDLFSLDLQDRMASQCLALPGAVKLPTPLNGTQTSA